MPFCYRVTAGGSGILPFSTTPVHQLNAEWFYLSKYYKISFVHIEKRGNVKLLVIRRIGTDFYYYFLVVYPRKSRPPTESQTVRDGGRAATTYRVSGNPWDKNWLFDGATEVAGSHEVFNFFFSPTTAILLFLYVLIYIYYCALSEPRRYNIPITTPIS